MYQNAILVYEFQTVIYKVHVWLAGGDGPGYFSKERVETKGTEMPF
jgi:hypothetical protein